MIDKLVNTLNRADKMLRAGLIRSWELSIQAPSLVPLPVAGVIS